MTKFGCHHEAVTVTLCRDGEALTPPSPGDCSGAVVSIATISGRDGGGQPW